jgi:hypothetical protein
LVNGSVVREPTRRRWTLIVVNALRHYRVWCGRLESNHVGKHFRVTLVFVSSSAMARFSALSQRAASSPPHSIVSSNPNRNRNRRKRRSATSSQVTKANPHRHGHRSGRFSTAEDSTVVRGTKDPKSPHYSPYQLIPDPELNPRAYEVVQPRQSFVPWFISGVRSGRRRQIPNSSATGCTRRPSSLTRKGEARTFSELLWRIR